MGFGVSGFGFGLVVFSSALRGVRVDSRITVNRRKDETDDAMEAGIMQGLLGDHMGDST